VEGYQNFDMTVPECCVNTSAVQMSVALSHLKACARKPLVHARTMHARTMHALCE
jgi:hypothetical protein